jgi:tetratricopeptide (TPR) repeat protein
MFAAGEEAEQARAALPDVLAIMDRAMPVNIPAETGSIEEIIERSGPASIIARYEAGDEAFARDELDNSLIHLRDEVRACALYLAVRWSLHAGHPRFRQRIPAVVSVFDLEEALRKAMSLAEDDPLSPMAMEALLMAVEFSLHADLGKYVPGEHWVEPLSPEEHERFTEAFRAKAFEATGLFVGRYPHHSAVPRVLLAIGFAYKHQQEFEQAEALFKRLAEWDRPAWGERAWAYRELHHFALKQGDPERAAVIAETAMRECAGRLGPDNNAYDTWPSAREDTPWGRLSKTGISSVGPVLLEHPEWSPDTCLAFEIACFERDSENTVWMPHYSYTRLPTATVAWIQRDENGAWCVQGHANMWRPYGSFRTLPLSVLQEPPDPGASPSAAPSGVGRRLPTRNSPPSPPPPPSQLNLNLFLLPRFPVHEGLEIVRTKDGDLLRQEAWTDGDDIVVRLGLAAGTSIEQRWQREADWWDSAVLEWAERTSPWGDRVWFWNRNSGNLSGSRMEAKHAPCTADTPTALELAQKDKEHSKSLKPVRPNTLFQARGTAHWAHLTDIVGSKSLRGIRNVQSVEVVQGKEGSRLLLRTGDLKEATHTLAGDKVVPLEGSAPVGGTFSTRDGVYYRLEADRISALAESGETIWTYQVPAESPKPDKSERVDFAAVINPVLIDGDPPFLFCGVGQRRLYGTKTKDPIGGGYLALNLDGTVRYSTLDDSYIDAITVDAEGDAPAAYAVTREKPTYLETKHHLVKVDPKSGEVIWAKLLYVTNDMLESVDHRSIALLHVPERILAVSLGTVSAYDYDLKNALRSTRFFSMDGEPCGALFKTVLLAHGDFDADGVDELVVWCGLKDGCREVRILNRQGYVLWRGPTEPNPYSNYWTVAAGPLDGTPGDELVLFGSGNSELHVLGMKKPE